MLHKENSVYQSSELGSAGFLAESIRHDLWGDARFPVDPVTICRELDVAVKQSNLPSELLGASARNVNDKPVIIVQSGDSDSLKRIACAQGLGYYINKVVQFDGSENSENKSYRIAYYRDETSAGAQDAASDHAFARDFALDLLIPPDKLASLFYERTIIQLSLFFGVPPSAIESQAQALNLHTRKSKHAQQQTA